jgi:hypothetical protein
MEGFLITTDPKLDDKERFQVYMGHFPAGASTQSIYHYAQSINSKKMQLYDWGSDSKNTEKYGQKTPPLVNLRNIKNVPTAMFVGSEDDLGDVTDARWARDEINAGGTALTYYGEVPAGHATFMIGKDMSYFDTVLSLI